MLMLGIDTSGKTASAALYEDGIMLGQTSVYTSKTHSQVILPMVKKIMSDCGRELSQLTDISVSSGPGSYTGIRIGIAAVKACLLHWIFRVMRCRLLKDWHITAVS